jgi:hypothetical protein
MEGFVERMSDVLCEDIQGFAPQVKVHRCAPYERLPGKPGKDPRPSAKDDNKGGFPDRFMAARSAAMPARITTGRVFSFSFCDSVRRCHGRRNSNKGSITLSCHPYAHNAATRRHKPSVETLLHVSSLAEGRGSLPSVCSATPHKERSDTLFEVRSLHPFTRSAQRATQDLSVRSIRGR